jgi:hypothetical protein
MYKLLLSLVLFWGCNENAVEFTKYTKAFDYIKNSSLIRHEFSSVVDLSDSTKPIPMIVSDTIVSLSISDFFGIGYDNQMLREKGKQILDSLMKEDEKMDFRPFVSKQVGKLSTDPHSRLVLFFSKPYTNKLIAEIFFSEEGSIGYRDLSRLNSSVKFLFTFDKNGGIEKVLTTTPQYE